MLKNHERTTKPLTEREKSYVPLVIYGFKQHDKDKRITAAAIVAGFNIHANKEIAAGRKMIRMNEPTLRRFVNYIRVNALLPIISGDGGYYVSSDVQELDNMELSLRQRARSINQVADGISKMAEFYRHQTRQQANS